MIINDILTATNGKLIGNIDINTSIENFCTDSRNIEHNSLYIPLIGEKFDGHDFIIDSFEKGAIISLTSKNISTDKPLILVEDTLKALQDIAKHHRLNKNIPIIALTGSVGKTTTKDMLHAVMSKKYNVLKTEGNFNNHIGVPKTLLRLDNHNMAIIEMGMNHSGELSILSNIALPDLAIINNIGYSHIGNLGSRENILKAKLEITDGLSENGKLIINNDDEYLTKLENDNLIKFGIKNTSDLTAYDIEIDDTTTRFKVNIDTQTYDFILPLPGEHFVYNALAAITVGSFYNVAPNDMIDALKNMTFTKMRMDIIEKNSIKIINDAYNASPDSMKASLNSLTAIKGDRKIAVLADMLELGEFSKSIHFEIGKSIDKEKIDYVLAYGNDSLEIINGALNNGIKNAKFFNTKEELIKELKELLRPNDCVLVKGSRGMKMDEVVNTIISTSSCS